MRSQNYPAASKHVCNGADVQASRKKLYITATTASRVINKSTTLDFPVSKSREDQTRPGSAITEFGISNTGITSIE